MITLEELEIEGFGSISKTKKFELNQPGLNILNSANGEGKTTIFSALCWVLFGKSLKNKSQVETWEDKRYKGWKGTMVTVRFAIDPGDKLIRIYRCIKYKDKIGGASGANRLIIVEDGKEKSFKDKNEAQKWIVKKLGMSFELFKNTVVFGQKMKRFIEEDGPTKKAIFEEIFDTSYIQHAKDMAIESREDYYKSLTQKETELSNIEIRLEGLEQLKKASEKHLKDFEDIKVRDLRRNRYALKQAKERIEEIAGKYKKPLNEEIERCDKSKNLVDLHKNIAFKLELTYQQNEAALDGSKKMQSKFVKELAQKHFTCSLCKQKLTPEHQAQHIKQLKQYIKEEKEKQVKLTMLVNGDKGLVKASLELVEKHSKIASRLTQLYEDKNEILQLNKEKKEYIEDIKEIKNRQPDRVGLDEVNTKIRIQLSKKIPLNKEVKHLKAMIEDCDWVIKDPLSNSGIKSFIFSQMVKKVNAKLTNYSHIINGLINFGVDLGSGNRDFYITIEKDGYLRFYTDQSGGEQQLINVCIAFAMYDTISESNPFNLLVLDECFENLDNANTEIVGDLIKAKSKGKSLFVITHRSNFIPNGSNIITL